MSEKAPVVTLPVNPETMKQGCLNALGIIVNAFVRWLFWIFVTSKFVPLILAAARWLDRH